MDEVFAQYLDEAKVLKSQGKSSNAIRIELKENGADLKLIEQILRKIDERRENIPGKGSIKWILLGSILAFVGFCLAWLLAFQFSEAALIFAIISMSGIVALGVGIIKLIIYTINRIN